MKTSQHVSVIATVLNESASIELLWKSLMAQSRPPDEIVIVDGGSTDGTWQRLNALAEQATVPVRLFCEEGCNISRGRNQAIAAARGPIIAITDAGVRLEDDWLEHLTAPFGQDSSLDIVSGFFIPEAHSLFERVLGAMTLPALSEINAATFYPSSRSVALRRQAWQAVGGYPEWLDYCEDLLFDFALRDAGYHFAFVPQAVVYFRPRSNLRAFIKQYYRYARGDGKADFWRWRHLVRYATYLVALPALIGLACAHHPLWWLGVLAVLAGLIRGPLKRLAPLFGTLSWRERIVGCIWAPIIRISGDWAKMVGYPVGIVWRWRHAPQEPWPKRQW